MEAAALTPMPRPATLDLRRVRLPLLTPHRTAYGVERDREVVLVAWRDPSGVTGWGECPTVGGGYGIGIDEAWEVLTSLVAPAVFAEGLPPVRSSDPAVRQVCAAVRDAAWDARWVATGTSAAVALGASSLQLPRTRVIASVGASVDEIVERAEAAVADGATQVKLKIQPGWDVEQLVAARVALGHVPLAADANGSYLRAADVPDALDELGLAYFEDPVGDLEELRALAARFRTPLAADESVTGEAEALAAVDAGATVVSIKPSRVGGMVAATEMAARLAARGVGCFVGGMLETGIGRAAALAVAAGPSFLLPTDLGPSSAYFAEDVCRPLTTDESGRLLVPAGRGIGRTPDEALLRLVTVDRRTFS